MNDITLISSASIGGILTFLIEGLKWAFPVLKTKTIWLRIIVIVLCVLFGAVVYLSQTDTTLVTWGQSFVAILLTSQTLYALVVSKLGLNK